MTKRINNASWSRTWLKERNDILKKGAEARLIINQINSSESHLDVFDMVVQRVVSPFSAPVRIVLVTLSQG